MELWRSYTALAKTRVNEARDVTRTGLDEQHSDTALRIPFLSVDSRDDNSLTTQPSIRIVSR